MEKDITLVVMAAGMGRRFGRLKQIEPIGSNGEVLLDFSVYDAVEAGFTKVVFVINHAIENDFKSVIEKRINKMVKVEYVYQEMDNLPDGYTCPEDRQKPWGTGHALLCCKDVVKEPFAVVNADDYYGKTAFAQIADFLKNNDEDYCMIGYRLSNTLNENGFVSRGICNIRNGELKTITVRTKILDCNYTENDGETWIPLPSDTIVSMNLWGFQPDFLEYVKNGFDDFLKEKLNVPKSEYCLSSIIFDLISSKQKKVKALLTEDKWYGVTYKEEKRTVVNAIEAMINKGLYKGI